MFKRFSQTWFNAVPTCAIIGGGTGFVYGIKVIATDDKMIGKVSIQKYPKLNLFRCSTAPVMYAGGGFLIGGVAATCGPPFVAVGVLTYGIQTLVQAFHNKSV